MQTADLPAIIYTSIIYFVPTGGVSVFSAGTSPKRAPPPIPHPPFHPPPPPTQTCLERRRNHFGMFARLWRKLSSSRQALMSDCSLQLQEKKAPPTQAPPTPSPSHPGAWRRIPEPSAWPLSSMLPTVPLKVVTPGGGDFLSSARNLQHHGAASSG